jgi:uncharacterized protein (DUF2267 family)
VTLVHATLRGLAQRRTAGEADDLRAVLATTRDAGEPGEFDDVLTQLDEEFARLVPGAR